MSEVVTPFRLDVPDAKIDDLRQRLRRTRWPEPETVGDWSQGTPLAYTRELCRYWLEDHDWLAAQERLNRFPQFLTTIDGLEFHFLHVRSPHPDALPLVITHGWPGSVAEFHKVIGPLTNPVALGHDASDAFHVVCPRLPGFGFSGKPDRTGWGTERIADAWDQLMARLGYPRYGAQGGDVGSPVTMALARRRPDSVSGIHLNMVPAIPAAGSAAATAGDLTVREQAALAAQDDLSEWGRGYAIEQSTRPQTVGHGLVDSPAGLCACIVEKFWAWSQPDVAIVDVRMPPGHTDEGLRAAIAIRQDRPGLPILMFSQYVETRYAADLLGMRSGTGAAGAAGVGYLLKDRVANVAEFIDALCRVAAGGTPLDPEVITQLLGASRHASSLATLTARERDVLALMADGRSNSGIGDQLGVSERAVEKHVSNIFGKLGLPASDTDHRRVLAVLAYLGS